jgi:hypothetical protein
VALESIEKTADAWNSMWGISNAVLERGWLATALPAVLASAAGEADTAEAPPEIAALPADIPAGMATTAAELADLKRIAQVQASARAASLAGTMTLLEILRAPRAQQRAVIRRAISEPSHVVRWLQWHAQRAVRSRFVHGFVTAARTVLSRPSI